MKREQLDPFIVLIEELNALRAHPLGEDYCSGIDDALSLVRSISVSVYRGWNDSGVEVRDEWQIVSAGTGSVPLGPYTDREGVEQIRRSIGGKFKVQSRIVAFIRSDWEDE